MNIEEFRRHGHALIDWLADYDAGLAARPVQAPTRPGEVRVMMPAEPPENPETFEACIADLDTIVAPHLSHWQHPRFFGYFPPTRCSPASWATWSAPGWARGPVLAILAGAQRG